MSYLTPLRPGLVALALALPLPALAQSSDTGTAATESQVETAATPADASTVVATVDGTDITLGHMILVRLGLPQQYNQLPPDVLFQGILDQLVQQAVLEKSFQGEVPKRVDLTLENERRALIAGEAVDDFLAGAVTEDEIEAAYSEKYSSAEPEVEYRAAHILVETEDEAKKLIEELDNGADFAELAKEHSTGPSGPNGGDLGWFGKGMMVPEFETAVAEMEPGAHSATPVKTQFGWHVIMLNETREKSAPKLEEVRDEIVNELQRVAVEAHIDELTQKAEIDRSGAKGVDPTLLTNSDLLE
ncbi:peptidylprolyl isomerase [Pseudooceanicola sp. 216_PA32_1]|jgi:peptidyl-prolyl cis-trans isomerase C|uniref:Parvulin-like PPIase n=1 Tax=Pseudooceanicola pacificus TaxID=2676438 RepID=A0A844VZC6_9RHOB|nr:peptidylprolyl isomerase [Pseudooceanicola pacificus]MWB76757.1 peptidylprolyl isomerase [Pseudooceanicola pacificus]